MKYSEIHILTIESVTFSQNSYVIHSCHSDKCFLIDPGFDPENILDVIQKQSLVLEAVLVTHGHVDHIAGISEVRNKWPQCEIWIGEDEKEKLTNAKANLSASFGLPITAPEPTRLLKDGEKTSLCGIALEVLQIPGHSRGHVVYHLLTKDRGILFVGDVIFQGSIGRSDFPDGNHDLLIGNIRKKILSLPADTVLYPGHGPETTVGIEQKTNPFFNKE